MLIKTIISGFGGQGVLFMGYCLASAAMEHDYYTTYLPSYGAEVRGGTANCTVAVSDDTIASPVASEPNFIVAMNNPSMVRFQSHLVSGGTLVINQDLVDIVPTRDDVNFAYVPAVKIATEIGNPKSLNVVMLGALVRQSEIVPLDCLENSVAKIFAEKSEKLVEVNIAALRAGYDWQS